MVVLKKNRSVDRHRRRRRMHFGHDLLSLFPLLLLLGHLSLFSLAPARFLALLSLVRFLGLFSLFLWLPSSAVLLGLSLCIGAILCLGWALRLPQLTQVRFLLLKGL